MILKLLLTSLLVYSIPSNSQLISITTCADTNCNTNCVSWIATNNKCTPCQGDPSTCSITNPSSITTSSTLRLYQDSTCTTMIPYTMLISLDSKCNPLYQNNNNVVTGSYRAYDLSAIIGGVIGGLTIVTIMICYICCRCRRKKPIPQNNNQSIPEYGYGYAVYQPNQLSPQIYPPLPVYPPPPVYPSQLPTEPIYYPHPSAPASVTIYAPTKII